MSQAADSYSVENQFRGKLARKTLLRLLPLVLLPVLILGAITINNTNNLLRTQLEEQITLTGQDQKKQYQNLVAEKEIFLANLENDSEFAAILNDFLTSPTDSPEYQSLKTQVIDYYQTALTQDPAYFDDLIITASDTSILVSTTPEWEGEQMASAAYQSLFDKPSSIALYHNAPFYYGLTLSNKLRLFTSQPHLTANGEAEYNLIGISNEGEFLTILRIGSVAYPSAEIYMVTHPTKDSAYLGITPGIGVSPYKINPLIPTFEHVESITPLLMSTNPHGLVEFDSSVSKQTVIARYDWVPELQIGMIIEVPKEDIIGPLRSTAILNIGLFLLAMAVLGVLIFFSTRRLVQPIQDVTQAVENFAQGDLQRRAIVKSDDELGLLAHTFNHMADELSALYRSLESVVAVRTEQVRTAAEVAQIATSATSLDRILQLTVDLIVERFDHYHASIYLVDGSREHAILRTASGELITAAAQGFRVRVGSHSIIGWVTEHNQPWVAADVNQDPYYLPVESLPETKSEVGIPLSLGDEILGALDVQNTHLDAFGEDDIFTLQTLANQIASAIKNIQILETTQTDLQATSLLYRASHTIAEAESFEDVFAALSETMRLVPYSAAIFMADTDQLRCILKMTGEDASENEPEFTIPTPTPDWIAGIPAVVPILIRQVSSNANYPEPLNAIVFHLDYEITAVFPVRVDDELAAFLILGTVETEPFTATILETINSLTEMTITALEKVNALQTITQRLAELQTLNTISQSISAETSLTNLYEIIHQQIIHVMGDVNFLIASFDPVANMIEIPYMEEGGEIVTIPPFPLGQGLTSIIIRSQQPLMIVEDTVNRSRALGAIVTGDTFAQSWLGVPLIVGGEVLGAIVVQDTEEEHRFDEDDLQLLTTLAAQVGIAIRNAMLIETAQDRANRDRQLYEVTSKIRHAIDMQSVLATTAEELSRVLGAQRTQINITLDPLAMDGPSDNGADQEDGSA
jgi:GAF domain-containing protein/HAMP domain-containing protein